jgi:hypothetical protein
VKVRGHFWIGSTQMLQMFLSPGEDLCSQVPKPLKTIKPKPLDGFLASFSLQSYNNRAVRQRFRKAPNQSDHLGRPCPKGTRLSSGINSDNGGRGPTMPGIQNPAHLFLAG